MSWIHSLRVPSWLAAGALLAALGPAAAVTLVGHDLSAPLAPYDWQLPPGTDLTWNDAHDVRKAVGATVPLGEAYWFDSLSAGLVFMTGSDADPTDRVAGGIHGDAGGRPGALLASFVEQTLSQPDLAAQWVTFTASDPVLLHGGQTYWFVLGDATQNNVDSAFPFTHWTVPASRVAPGDGEGTLAGYRISYDGGANWGSSGVANAVQIEVSAVPEPQAWALMLGGLGFVAARVRRRQTAG